MPVGPAEITAVILAGGLGTRLRPVLSNLPKALASVNGVPFIFRLLDRLEKDGLRRAIVCTGYMADILEEAVGKRSGELDIAFSREPAPLGTGGALRNALPVLDTETVLAMNGDSWCDYFLTDLMAFHERHSDGVTMVLTEVQDITRYGSVSLNESGAVASFNEKGARSGKGLINAGIYLLPRSVIGRMTVNQNISLEREVFPTLITDGQLFGFVSTGNFIDIGVPEDYREAQNFFPDENSIECTVEKAS